MLEIKKRLLKGLSRTANVWRAILNGTVFTRSTDICVNVLHLVNSTTREMRKGIVSLCPALNHYQIIRHAELRTIFGTREPPTVKFLILLAKVDRDLIEERGIDARD